MRRSIAADTVRLNWFAAAFVVPFLLMLVPPPALVEHSFVLFADQQTVIRDESVTVVIEQPGHYELHDPGARSLNIPDQSHEDEPSAAVSRERVDDLASRFALLPSGTSAIAFAMPLASPFDLRLILNGLTVGPWHPPPRPSLS